LSGVISSAGCFLYIFQKVLLNKSIPIERNNINEFNCIQFN